MDFLKYFLKYFVILIGRNNLKKQKRNIEHVKKKNTQMCEKNHPCDVHAPIETQLHTKFQKIIGAVFVATHRRWTEKPDFIAPLGFKPGTKNII